MAADLRTALRRLRRRPGQALAAVGSLALGIGAAASVFAVVEASLLTPPPFREPDRLVLIWGSDAASSRSPIAAPDAAMLADATSLGGLAFLRPSAEAALETGDGVVPVRTGVATPSLFPLLGVRPAAGRLIRDDEAIADDPDDPPPAPVLLSHGFWRAAFAADPAIPGRPLRLDGRPVTVVGVLPPGFRLPLPAGAGVAPVADVWLPVRTPLSAFARETRFRDQDSDNRGVVVARLAPGVSTRSAERELDALAARNATGSVGALDLRVVPLLRDATAAARPILLVLMAAVGLVLLLTCASVAVLLLARGEERRRELAVRSALGAGRWGVVAPLVAEGALIGAAAGVSGLTLALWATPALARLAPSALALPAGIGLDLRVLGFGILTTLLATILATVLPALRRPSDDEGLLSLRSGAAADAPGAARSRRALVIVELALSLALLVGAGLLARTFAALQAVDPGFDPAGVATFDLALIYPDGYRGPADRAAFVRALERRLDALPEVAAVGVIGGAPLSGERFTQPWRRPGDAPDEWVGEADYRVISEGYFEALATPVVDGRAFRPEDDRQDRRVVIVDRALAARVAPDGRVVGRRIVVPVDGEPVEAEIVGVVDRVRFDDLRSAGRPAVYVPYRHEASRRITVALRAVGDDPARLAPAVRRELATLDPRLPAFDFSLMTDHVDTATAGPRFAMLLMLGFAAVADLIAVIGLYGLIAHGVVRRTAEMGVRMALGADGSAVVLLVLRQALGLVGAGIALGLVAAAALSVLMRSVLFGVSAGDPLTWLGVATLLLATALLAALVPARRASRIHPAEALRRGG